MKVSLNLAQEFSNVDLKSIPRDELLKRVGAQLGAVEDVIDWAPKFEGAVIVKVTSYEKHPNADKLSVCRIDDGGKNQSVERGEDGLIQVVCGAPNVHVDMFAVWLAPGVTVPNSRDKDPFILEAREIRGVVSNGMLASAHELGISDDHNGIVDATAEDAGKEPVPGEPLTNYFGLDDFVIDCENKMFTHRPDCFGNLGVARELAGISGLSFQSPDWYLNPPQFEIKEGLPLEAKNEAQDLVPRFMAVAMSSITVKPSPMWLQATLARVGIKPINNVVDVTNYVMHLTGQPLHAFDYDKIKERSDKPGIFPRPSQRGEKLTLLGQKEIELTGEEIVISTDKQAVALGGVMGGFDTEVDENTKNIIIECATFDMFNVRRTSMRFGLFTDAVTRFNKGQSPLQNDRVLAFAMRKMAELAGAGQASNVFDSGSDFAAPEVMYTTEFINQRLGSELSSSHIMAMLQNVEFGIEAVPFAKFKVTPPFWRMDIEIPEDIIEEVGRLYGYDKLPVNLPPRSAKPTPKNELFEYKQHLRYRLKEAGANEVLTYSFVHGDLMRKTGTDPEKWAYHIRNAISPDLQYYRTSLMPSLLAKVHPNIKAQAGSTDNQFALFETGKAHVKGFVEENGLPQQKERIAVVVAADDKTAKSHQSGAAFYQARIYLEALTGGQAVITSVEDFDDPALSAYADGRRGLVTISGTTIGIIGEFNPETRKSLKLPGFTAGFELDIERLQHHLGSAVYEPLPEFPGLEQDITFEVSQDMAWADLAGAVTGQLEQESSDHGIVTYVRPGNIFQKSDDGPKRISFRVGLRHPHRTLTTKETTSLLDRVATILANKHNANRI